VGTRRSNKRRGGGTAKGPKPRDYEYHLPKKAVRAATRMAVLSKFQDNQAVILDGLVKDVLLDDKKVIKTKKMLGILKALKVGETCLIGTAGLDADVWRAARNLPKVAVAPTAEFNAYTVLKQKRLVLTRAAFDQLRQAGQAKA
jgi:large subunit ribosomal protein L4